jgi:hypothetical protein
MRIDWNSTMHKLTHNILSLSKTVKVRLEWLLQSLLEQVDLRILGGKTSFVEDSHLPRFRHLRAYLVKVGIQCAFHTVV